jgi:hypothetical protein
VAQVTDANFRIKHAQVPVATRVFFWLHAIAAKGHMRLKLGLFQLALGTLLAFFGMFTCLLNYRQHKAVPRHSHPRTSCVPSHTPASCCAWTVLTTHVGC